MKAKVAHARSGRGALRWIGGWVGVAVVITLRPGAAQVRPIDAERLLAERFGFSSAEVAQARGGQSVAKMLPANDAPDVGVLGAVRIGGTADRLAAWLQDVAAFRKAAELGLSRRVSDPPRIEDFDALVLDAAELSALRACRPGRCDLRMGDTAIRRIQAGVNWTAPDAGTRATRLVRQLLLEHAEAYLKGRDQALGAYHDDKAPRVLADEFHQVLWQSKALYEIAPAIAAYLEGFPSARLAGAEQFLYWGKGGAGPEASITLHQMVIYRAPGGEVWVADKQLYASRYVDAALTVVSLASAPDGAGFYAPVGARARSSMLSGMGTRVLRGRVERATIDTARMYLDWVHASLTR